MPSARFLSLPLVGCLYPPALALGNGAGLTMAPLGARAAHAMDVAQSKRAFAVLPYALAARMPWHATTT